MSIKFSKGLQWYLSLDIDSFNARASRDILADLTFFITVGFLGFISVFFGFCFSWFYYLADLTTVITVG